MVRPRRVGYMKSQRDLFLEFAVSQNWHPMKYLRELEKNGFSEENALKEVDFYIDNRQALKYKHRKGKLERTVEETGYKPKILASKLKPTGLTKAGVKMWINKYKEKKNRVKKYIEEIVDEISVYQKYIRKHFFLKIKKFIITVGICSIEKGLGKEGGGIVYLEQPVKLKHKEIALKEPEEFTEVSI